LNLKLGVGDSIHICQHSFSSWCVPFHPPNFYGIIVKICSWSATHITFKVCCVSSGVVVPGSWQTIYLLVNNARLSWYHWIWGSIFIYSLTGWEGSVTDAWLWDQALKGGLKVRAGKYLLADERFPSCEQLLIPYCSVRYHLAEWGCANVR
jgi:hypothetical protein